jgi:TetR/AcrR family transcriptional regulator
MNHFSYVSNTFSRFASICIVMTKGYDYTLTNMVKCAILYIDQISQTHNRYLGGGTIPYESFEKLEDSKKQKIINAGFMVFSEHGYAKTSVDEIVKAAEISKGSLFYYFGSKLNFYLYLYQYCGEQLERMVDSHGDDGRPSYMAYDDFFERMNYIGMLKSKHFAEHPHMYSFMKKAILDSSKIIRDETARINLKYIKEKSMHFFQGINYSKFKEGIDPMMVLQLLTWTSEGCANQIALKYNTNSSSESSSIYFDEVVHLYLSYVELFRRNFYKEEYL